MNLIMYDKLRRYNKSKSIIVEYVFLTKKIGTYTLQIILYTGKRYESISILINLIKDAL
jgi:hypothetical protein